MRACFERKYFPPLSSPLVIAKRAPYKKWLRRRERTDPIRGPPVADTPTAGMMRDA